MPPSDNHNHVEFAAETIVFAGGEVGDNAYFIETGFVDIIASDGTDRVIATRGPGEIFGEMAIIDGGPRSAMARTKTRCRLTRLSSEAITREFGRIDPIMGAIMTTMLSRLREQSSATPLDDEFTDTIADRQIAILSAISTIRAETELLEAIERNEIGLFYQPIIDLTTQQIVGFEGLARWHHPVRGTLAPGHFIGLAEKTGQIGRLTQSCLAQAVAALPNFHSMARRSGMRLPYVNINVSGQDLTTEDFAQKLDRMTSNTAVNRHLQLEITESALIADPKQALRTLNDCRSMGVGIAIDDFGTGYSNLSYLHELPIDVLKIDRSFIQSMGTSEQSGKIVGSIVKLAETLELPTISEGLESWTDVGAVSGFGCEFGQGFYFAKPMPLSAIPDFLSRWDGIAATNILKRA